MIGVQRIAELAHGIFACAARDGAACSTESAAILFHALGSRARPPTYERVGASLDNEVKLEDMI